MDGALSSHEEAHQDIILDWAFSPPPPHYPLDLLEPIPVPSVPAKRPPPSAFVEYTASEGTAPSFRCFGDVDNIHRRVNRFLGSMEMAIRPGNSDERAGTSRGFRHMIRERKRREKLSQGYAELHSMLSCTSKGDKISVVQSAVERLKELQQAREKLRKRSRELELMVSGNVTEAEVSSIKVDVKNCSSSLDSMISVLRRLKHMELKATAIQSTFSNRDLSVEVATDSKRMIEFSGIRASIGYGMNCNGLQGDMPLNLQQRRDKIDSCNL
ncbi:hypothetical protein C4D60_Mb10t19960 [Musa balbisiana]|uniref:BHLH domain-containing protein n=1 Tax=Musa balbisiana TaxID=52838 RepID=A0A4S8J0X9_MUSBA|nr:hypothetical protein C4D60_Mb10t19960 [Musa balbisiana]